jgi:hypothetical protein
MKVQVFGVVPAKDRRRENDSCSLVCLWLDRQGAAPVKPKGILRHTDGPLRRASRTVSFAALPMSMMVLGVPVFSAGRA